MGYLNSVLQSSSQVHSEDRPASGGGLSQNGKFSYGYASSPGKRSSMEDFYETRIDGVDGEIVGLFGVFDGISSLTLIYLSLSHSCKHILVFVICSDIVAVLQAISQGLLLAQDGAFPW
ncbi:hypothetical protein Golob_009712 [Gossypium lobatum]|uniref:Uncharacterized protein n=1 Tax=Gossypium lobatum TaxID=34289 RepID=A0A7J8MJN1_9ROSI|nr:hypothetical protein [Gossypium lobatum]